MPILLSRTRERGGGFYPAAARALMRFPRIVSRVRARENVRFCKSQHVARAHLMRSRLYCYRSRTYIRERIPSIIFAGQNRDVLSLRARQIISVWMVIINIRNLDGQLILELSIPFTGHLIILLFRFI